MRVQSWMETKLFYGYFSIESSLLSRSKDDIAQFCISDIDIWVFCRAFHLDREQRQEEWLCVQQGRKIEKWKKLKVSECFSIFFCIASTWKIDFMEFIVKKVLYWKRFGILIHKKTHIVLNLLLDAFWESTR